MARRGIRVFVTFALAALMVLSSASMALAPHVARLEVDPGTAEPGDEVTIFGPDGYGPDSEVEIYWNDVDGELLGTFEPDEGFYAPFGPVEITIPEDAENGQHQIVANQELNEDERYIRGLPAYAQIQVVGGAEPSAEDAGEAPEPADDPGVERVSTLSESEPPGVGLLVLVGAGTLVLALAVAAAVAKGTRRGTPERATQPTER